MPYIATIHTHTHARTHTHTHITIWTKVYRCGVMHSDRLAFMLVYHIQIHMHPWSWGPKTKHKTVLCGLRTSHRMSETHSDINRTAENTANSLATLLFTIGYILRLSFF